MVELVLRADCLAFSISVPPSVNRLYKKGRFGNKYRDPELILEEGDDVAAIRQIMRRIKWSAIPPIGLSVQLFWNRRAEGRRRRDLDNILKVLLDRVSAAIGVDDDLFHDIHLKKTLIEDVPSYVMVEIRSLGVGKENE